MFRHALGMTADGTCVCNYPGNGLMAHLTLQCGWLVWQDKAVPPPGQSTLGFVNLMTVLLVVILDLVLHNEVCGWLGVCGWVDGCDARDNFNHAQSAKFDSLKSR